MNEHVPSTEHETPAGAFQFLVGRARDYVEACGGCVAEERLIAHVFGTTKSPDTWRPLFESVIQHAPDLRRRIDGMWAFADAATVGQLLLGDQFEGTGWFEVAVANSGELRNVCRQPASRVAECRHAVD